MRSILLNVILLILFIGSIYPQVQNKSHDKDSLSEGLHSVFSKGDLFTIFVQNFDSVTAPAIPSGWVATPGANTWQTTTSAASAGYTGASGGKNLIASNDIGLLTLSITTNAIIAGGANVSVGWGARRTGSFTNMITFEWSTDNVKWTPVSYDEVPNYSTWALVNKGKPILLGPEADNKPMLYFRWTYTQINNTGNYRIDDFRVQSSASTTTYYYQGTGDLHSTSSWWTNPDGNGTNPTDFASSNQTFEIRNTTSINTSGLWSISGSDSKVVLGNSNVPAVNLIVTVGNPIVGRIELSAPSSGSNTITLENDTIPTVGFCHQSSTVIFNRLSSYSYLPSAQFGNLTIRGMELLSGEYVNVTNNITIETGAYLRVLSGTLAFAGGFVNNGNVAIEDQLQLNTGGWTTGNAFEYVGNAILIFNNSTGPYEVNGSPLWPSSDGPRHVVQQNGGGIKMNVRREVGYDISTGWGGIWNANNLSIPGYLFINNGGFVVGSPYYNPDYNSPPVMGWRMLNYSTGGQYSVGDEWTGTGSGGYGAPLGVAIYGTRVDLPSSLRGTEGDINIESGTLALNGADLIVGGSWHNNGTFISNSRKVIFNSTSPWSTVSGSMIGSNKFFDLTFDGVEGSWSMSNDVEVSDTLRMMNGNVTTGSKTIILDPGSTLIENQTLSINGNVSESRIISDTLGIKSFGNLGVDLAFHGVPTGNLKIVRNTGNASTGNGKNSILRHVTITPEMNTGLNADLTFFYRTSELNGKKERALKLYKSADSGSTWTMRGGIVDTINHNVSITGLDGFSRWTLSDDANSLGGTPTPITAWIVPVSKMVGSGEFTLSVHGKDFIKDSSIVRYNGVDRVTIFINESELSANISATDLDTPGMYNVSVFNAGGGGESNAQLFTVRETLIGSIGGTIFNDLNGNGIREGSETALIGWKVILKDSVGVTLDSLMTDSTGNYTFQPLLDGRYTVSEDIQQDWQQTYPESPDFYSVTIEGSNSVESRDFGNFYYGVPPPPAFTFKMYGIDNGGQQDSIRFGVDLAATRCVDPELGEQVLPPPPYEPYFDLRWLNPQGDTDACFGNGINKDVRPFISNTQVDTFKFSFAAGWGGFPFTVRWGGEFMRHCDSMKLYYNGSTAGDITIDMFSVASHVIADPTVQSLQIIKWGAKDTVGCFGPDLVSPAYAAVNQPPMIDLKWEHLFAARGYRMQISTDPDFSVIVLDDTVVTTSSRVGPLADNTTFYWRVSGINYQGGTCWSSVGVFTTAQSALTYGIWQPFRVDPDSPFKSRVHVSSPEDLFVLVKKTTRTGYWGTWDGNLKLSKDGSQLAYRNGNPDYDIHLVAADSGLYDLEVTSTEHGEGIIKICSGLDTLNLSQWKTGQILRPLGSDWMEATVPSGQDTLYIQTEGYGMWSTIDVYRDILGSASNHWHFDNYGAGYQIKGIIVNPISGRYYIRCMDSAVLQSSNTQERQYLIFVSAHPITQLPDVHPLITNLSTYKCGKVGPARVTIFGSGFDSAATVSLIRSGLANIFSSSRSVDSLGRTITATFDLSAVASGEWTVKVMNPDGDSATCPTPFVVEDGGVVDLWVEIVGRDVIRIGRKQTYVVNYGNRGTITAMWVPVWISGIPSGANFGFRTRIFSPSELGLDTLDYTGVTGIISDSSKLKIPIFITFIPPGYSGSLEFYIEIPESLGLAPFTLHAWINQPFVSSEEVLAYNKTAQSKLTMPELTSTECVSSWIDLGLNAIGYIPGAPCVAYLTSYVTQTVLTNTPGLIPSLVPGPTSSILLIAGQTVDALTAAAGCGASIFPTVALMANGLSTIIGAANVYNNCFREPKEKEKETTPATSVTPEDKLGASGYDRINVTPDTRYRYVDPSAGLSYRIEFWNKEDATAPAQEVFIRDTLDENFDLTTLNFTEVGFLRWTVKLEGGQYFNTNIDMRPDMNLIVNVEGKLNVDSRAIQWTFRSLDPATMELPEDPMAGFLPPIDSTGYQIGWVNYTVKPKEGLPSGTRITNQAFVNFDGVGPWNPAPKEAPFLNTIDAVSPSSKIDSLPSVASDTTVTLRFRGWDDLLGSGVTSYSVYVSVDSGSFAPWRTYVKDTSVQFTGLDGHRYAFYSIAQDGVGNSEAMKSSPDAQTLITIVDGMPLKQGLPNEYALRQNYPNPFNPVTTFEYQLPQISRVTLKIYNVLGQLIATLSDGIEQAGYKSVNWDASNVASAVYFYRLEATSISDPSKSFIQVKKMILLK